MLLNFKLIYNILAHKSVRSLSNNLYRKRMCILNHCGCFIYNDNTAIRIQRAFNKGLSIINCKLPHCRHNYNFNNRTYCQCKYGTYDIKNGIEGTLSHDETDRNKPVKLAETEFDVDGTNSEKEDVIIEDFTVEEPDIATFPGVESDIDGDFIAMESLTRGSSGVFDLHEVVDLLREHNVHDLCVLRVPAERQYVDFLVVGTCLSLRHIRGLAEMIRVVYKKKRNDRDPIVRIEGLHTDWIAMDMGNIALHLFLSETRELYDLEMLWTVGEDYDQQCQAMKADMTLQKMYRLRLNEIDEK